MSGGAPLPVELKRNFEKEAGVILVEGYGLSETSPVAACNPLDGPVKEGSIGLPLPGTHHFAALAGGSGAWKCRSAKRARSASPARR